MSSRIQSIIETIFSRHGELKQPVDFEWRLIYRFGRPFLLLPAAMREAQAGLKIYSAQRPQAKIWRKLVPLMFKTPAARFFPRHRYRADAASEIMQFMAQQTAMPASRLATPAIMFSGTDYKSRVTLLLCDADRRPRRVIKIGLNSAWRKVTDQEASLMEQLPSHLPGCMKVTGKLSTPSLFAFAMDYAPGVSPADDSGLEKLFHAWLNPSPAVPLTSLEIWRDLAAKVTASDLAVWDTLQAALAEKQVRTTLFHGDFSPWNICVTSSQQIQAFDWERSHLQGIPGWDWFHFIIQTSILARKNSAARAAAEAEQLLHSPRFQRYAAEAGISDIAQPLLLAYLLHYLWTFKPMEGAETTRELFELLFENWQLKPVPKAVTAAVPVASGQPSTAWAQLKSALGMWRDLFWEPKLNTTVLPPMTASLRVHWPVLFLSFALMVGFAVIQYLYSASIMLLPFYLGVCALVTWQAGRRWGLLAAAIAGLAAPLAVATRHPDYRPAEVWLWNSFMRFAVLAISVLFLDRMRRQRDFFKRGAGTEGQGTRLADAWMVILASLGVLAGVGGLDWFSKPQMIFLPLYLIPCIMTTLTLGWRWGVIFSILSALTGAWIEFLTLKDSLVQSLGWNFLMRLAVLLTVLLLLNRITRSTILFTRRPAKNP